MGCCDSGCEIAARSLSQKRVLWWVLLINALMFFVLVFGAFWGSTVSLFAESFDSFGDAITYAITIWAVGKGAQTKAKVALFKGILILLGALLVMVALVFKWYTSEVPVYEVMGGFAAANLLANLLCLGLLWKYRKDDLNMESVWHCSRNDIVTSLSVIFAALLVWYFDSWVPDAILGGVLFLYLLRSGMIITNKSIKQMKSPVSDC